MAVPSFWNPLKSLHGLVGGNRTFHQIQIRFPPLPCRFWELVLGEAGESWSQSWLCALPSLFTSIPHGGSLQNYHGKKAYADINFF